MDPSHPSKAWLGCWDPYTYIREGLKRFATQDNFSGEVRKGTQAGLEMAREARATWCKAFDWARAAWAKLLTGAFSPARPDGGEEGKEMVGFESCQQTSPVECSSSWADRLREGHGDAELTVEREAWNLVADDLTRLEAGHRNPPPNIQNYVMDKGFKVQRNFFFLTGVTWIIYYFEENLLNLFYGLELWLLCHNQTICYWNSKRIF